MNEPLILAEPETPFWGFGEIFVAVAVFLVALEVVVTAARAALHDGAKIGYWQVAEESAAYLVLFIALKIIFFLNRQPLFRSLGWVPSSFGAGTLIGSGLALVVFSVFLQALLRTPQIQTPFEDLLNGDPVSRVAISLFGVSLSPIVEELVFRGFFQPVLVGATGAFPGILITSCLFGALHLAQNAGLWQSGVLIAIAGFAFGVVRHVTGSTRASAVMHIAYNSLPFLLTLAQGAPTHHS